MNRTVRSTLFALGGLLFAAASPLAAQAKLGFVNIQQVMTQAPGLAEARTTFEAEVQRAQPELQRMAAELDSLQTDLQRQQATLTEAARTQRQTDLQTRYTTYQQRQAALQQREQALLAPISQRVEAVIEAVRKEGGYAMIFDSAESGIVAADQTLDLTNRILDRLKTTPAGQ
ncbi:MAG: OmpH family outer membrane protein [Gemmatimonadetes bacterium]|nr:OmpH family outer membrane protein [Gemmatimonadota bacterium]